jgi:hypothetical protein
VQERYCEKTGAKLFENFINDTDEHGHTGQISTRAS